MSSSDNSESHVVATTSAKTTFCHRKFVEVKHPDEFHVVDAYDKGWMEVLSSSEKKRREKLDAFLRSSRNKGIQQSLLRKNGGVERDLFGDVLQY